MSVQRIRSDGSAISIEHRGLPPVPITSLLLMLVLLLFGGVVGGLALENLAPKLDEGWYLSFDWWWRILLYLMIFVGPVILIGSLVVWHMTPSFIYLKSAVFTARDHALAITRSSFLGLKRKTDVDLHEISEIHGFIGAERAGPIHLRLELESDLPNPTELELEIEEVDQRDEALDVLFAIARLSGLSRYKIDENEADCMVVVVGGQDLQDATPIPEAKRAARYDLDLTAAAGETPAPRVAKLKPDRYSSLRTRLENWNPGQLVRFHRPPCSTIDMVVRGIASAIVVGLAAFFIAAQFEGISSTLMAAGGALAGLLGGALVAKLREPEREVVIESGAKRLTWRTGLRRHHCHLGEVDSVVLQELEHTVNPKNSPSYIEYRCKLLLKYRSGEEILLTENDEWDRSSDSQRKFLEPLAAAVAAEIGVRWRWLGYQPPTVSRILNSLGQAAILLFLIGIMSFFAWGVWQQGKYRAEWDAAAKKIEALGSTVTRAGINIGDVHIFGDGLMVEIDDREFTDDDLKRLLELLEPIPLYALDLSNTSVTNEGLRQFVGRNALYLLDLRGTDISPAAVDILAKTTLTSIDFRDTPIRLEHLDAFRELHALKVLFITDDEVSEEDLWTLDSIPYLDAVLINDEQTTRQIADRLNRVVPSNGTLTEVERQRMADAFSLKVAGEMRYTLD